MSDFVGQKKRGLGSDGSDVALTSKRVAITGNSSETAELQRFKLLCPQPYIGLVIGKGGSMVNRISRETSVDIKISQNDDYFPGTNDRVILFTGKIDGMHQAIKEIVTIMTQAAERQASNSMMPLNTIPNRTTEGGFEIRVLIPWGASGSMIGKGGVTIKRMTVASSCKMQLGEEVDPYQTGERVFIIGSSKMENVVQGAQTVMMQFLTEAYVRTYQNTTTSYQLQNTEGHQQFNAAGAMGMIMPSNPSMMGAYPAAAAVGNTNNAVGGVGGMNMGMMMAPNTAAGMQVNNQYPPMGMQATTQQGMQPIMQQGMQPVMQQQAMQPLMQQQGMQQQGMQQQGMQQQGMQQQGMQQPLMQQGMQQGMQHGMQQPMQQPMQPVMQQGMQPVMQQGIQQQPMQQGMQQQGMQSQGMQPQGMQPQGMQPQGMQPQGMQQQGMQQQGMQQQGMQVAAVRGGPGRGAGPSTGGRGAGGNVGVKAQPGAQQSALSGQLPPRQNARMQQGTAGGNNNTTQQMTAGPQQQAHQQTPLAQQPVYYGMYPQSQQMQPQHLPQLQQQPQQQQHFQQNAALGPMSGGHLQYMGTYGQMSTASNNINNGMNNNMAHRK